MTSILDRLSINATVAAALAAGRPGRGARIDADQPRPAVSPERRGGEGFRGGRPRRPGPCRRPLPSTTGRSSLASTTRPSRPSATAPAGTVMKASRPSLSAALTREGWSATTVSATMIAAHAAGIRVFATGGIGGVHRGALGGPGATREATFDISSDLEELAKTPMIVVCAGPKSILDVPATLEVLETRGVPVVAVGQEDLPGFTARSSGNPRPVVGRDRRGRRRPRGRAPRARARQRHRDLRARPGRRGPARRRRPRGGRSGRLGGRSRERPRPEPDALAAGPDCRADRRRLRSGQHRADRQRRRRCRPDRGSPGRLRLTPRGPAVARRACSISIFRAFDCPLPIRDGPDGTIRVPQPPSPVGFAVPAEPSPQVPPAGAETAAVATARGSDVHARPGDRRQGRSPRVLVQGRPDRRPRRGRPRGPAGRVLRAARAERRGQDDPHQDPDDAPVAVVRIGQRLRLRRREGHDEDPPDHEHGRGRRAVGLRHPDRPRAALDVHPVLRAGRGRGLAPRRRAHRGRRSRASSGSSGSAPCRPASARR